MYPIEDLRAALSDAEQEYSDAMEREDYTTAFRVFGDIEALRQELLALEDEEV